MFGGKELVFKMLDLDFQLLQRLDILGSEHMEILKKRAAGGILLGKLPASLYSARVFCKNRQFLLAAVNADALPFPPLGGHIYKVKCQKIGSIRQHRAKMRAGLLALISLIPKILPNLILILF